MKERPILFSAPMVRAILEGRKTQTRRVIKHDYIEIMYPEVIREISCPYGKPGDRLWVRETFRENFCLKHQEDMPLQKCTCGFSYRADCGDDGTTWRPSIHMPRKASRINLEITNVRVERLNEISGYDAYAEGADMAQVERKPDGKYICTKGTVDFFKDIWESINGEGSWEKNPWVWCIDFRRVI